MQEPKPLQWDVCRSTKKLKTVMNGCESDCRSKEKIQLDRDLLCVSCADAYYKQQVVGEADDDGIISRSCPRGWGTEESFSLPLYFPIDSLRIRVGVVRRNKISGGIGPTRTRCGGESQDIQCSS